MKIEEVKELCTKIIKDFGIKNNIIMTISFMNENNNCTATTTNQFYYDDVTKRTLSVYHINFSINNIVLSSKGKRELLLNFLKATYHEIYHVMVTESGFRRNCFNLDTLNNYLCVYDDEDDFINNNYDIINEELKAEMYGIKKAFQFFKDKHIEITKELWQKNIKVLKKLNNILINNDKYIYRNKTMRKDKVIYEYLNDLIIADDFYLEIIAKAYDVDKNRPKTIDELLSDFEVYYLKSKDNEKIRHQIILFYSSIIKEMLNNNEKVDAKNLNKVKCLLKYAKQDKKGNILKEIQAKLYFQKYRFNYLWNVKKDKLYDTIYR